MYWMLGVSITNKNMILTGKDEQEKLGIGKHGWIRGAKR